MRLLVVGASSGIGRAIAEGAVASGHTVVATARRRDALEAIAGVRSVAADVRDEAACAALAATTLEQLGGLDALVYAAGVAPLQPLVSSDAELWRAVLETNVVGASLVTRGVVGALAESGGRAAYLSMGHTGRPWPFLGAYSASKAALEELVEAWRTEHTAVAFTRVSVGPTLTPMAEGWDPALAGEAFGRWQRDGHLPTMATMPADGVADRVLEVIAGGVRIDDLRLMPNPG